jgi:hypothetical protein
MKRFCQYIRQLIMCRNKSHIQCLASHPFSAKMVIHLDVLCSTVEEWISS